MSDAYDPYRPPSTLDDGDRPRAGGDDAAVSQSVLDALRETRPWATFLGVLGFVMVGLMVLGGLGVMAAGAFGGAKMGAAMGLLYIVFAGLYVYPSLCLVRYGSSISRLLVNPDQESLAAALVQQKSFWRFAGISTIIMMVLYGVAIFIGVAVGIATARH